MAPNVNGQPVRTLANSDSRDLADLRREPARMRIDANSDGILASSGVTRARVREAIRLAGSSQKEFAINAKQSESVISEALGGSRAVNADWIEAQGPAFRLHYHGLQKEQWNIDRKAEEDELRAVAARFFSLLFERRTA